VWVGVSVGFVTCVCSGNMCTCIYRVFVLFVLCFCIVSFMYIYSTMTVSFGYILYCGCFNWFCNVCVCVGCVIRGCVYVWVL